MNCFWWGAAARAAGLHLGLIVALEMRDFVDDDLGRLGNPDGSTRFVRDRDMIRRSSEIDREWWTVEILTFGQVVDEVENHPCPLHEGQAQNGVDRDVRTRSDQE